MTEPSDPNELVKVTFTATRAERRSLREEALRRDLTISQIILEALKNRIVFYERKGETK